MGWETALFLGLEVAKGVQGVRQAKQEAKAVVAEANIQAANKAKEVRRQVAASKMSFLSSGLSLEGTPMISMQGVFDTGLQDIGQIVSNANSKSKRIMSSARSDFMSGIMDSVAPMAGGIDFGATASGVSSASQGFGFGVGYDVSKSVNNPSNKGIF